MTRALACRRCLARTWLIGQLAGHLNAALTDLSQVLSLSNADLLAAVGGRRRGSLGRELAQFRCRDARAHLARAGLEAICRCHDAYPARLRELDSPPAVIHLIGGSERLRSLADRDTVAIVGSRRATPYGLEVAAGLARALACAGVVVISGMALGIDSAAHQGALAGGETIAVLPGGAERAYPASRRALHRQIAAKGVVLSELPPGVAPRRWMFPARNRVIAGLADVTVVVEAATGSGALLTAGFARRLGRAVGAVPGRITSVQAEGCHGLLAQGARIIRGPEDLLDCLFAGEVRPHVPDRRAGLEPAQRRVLEAIAAGDDTLDALARARGVPDGALAELGWLELAGYVHREPGGRYAVVP